MFLLVTMIYNSITAPCSLRITSPGASRSNMINSHKTILQIFPDFLPTKELGNKAQI